jgi:hypothetical protein
LDHNSFTYKEGLVVDSDLYYTKLEHLPLYYTQEWPFVADVTLPDGARVYADPCGTKWKADRLVLSNVRPISKLLAAIDEVTLDSMVARDGTLLKHVETQTEAICLTAVRQNGYALQYVQNQTDAICRTAVAQEPDARRYVKIP